MRPATLIFSISTLLILVSCKHKEKNPCEDVFCDPPASVFGPNLRFTLHDANDRDYFFSQPPVYAYSQLTVSILDSSGHVPVIVDTFSSSPTHSFIIPAPSPGKNRALLIKMADKAPDTLRFDEERYNASCCYIAARLTNIRLNGKFIQDKFEGVGINILTIHSTR